LGEDLRLRPGAWRRLSDGRARKRAALYSANAPRREGLASAAWRLTAGDPAAGVYPVPLLRRAKRVYAAGWDCTLAEGCAFAAMDFSASAQDPAPANPELTGAAWARRRGLRWFADGGVPAFLTHAAPGDDSLPGNAAAARVRRVRDESPAAAAPRVSVIIPARNAAKTLHALLESLGRVEFPPGAMEILVVDNGSRDRTADVARGFEGVSMRRAMRG
jgi:hypothetical protein